MSTPRRLLASATIFSGAFLLFAVEPLFAKRILPWFGGSAAVWTTCLVFYQTALLAGYLYARLSTRYLQPWLQTAVHVALLVGSLLLLPIGPSDHWQRATVAHPAWEILVILSATLGLPFVILSATSPLVQHWLARSGDEAPYGLFAISNLASLAALLAYPAVIEPYLDVERQRFWWSVGFAVFVLCCGALAVLSASDKAAKRTEDAEGDAIPIFRPVYWFALGACGSMLLLSVTNHITENVAAVPLLWILPLAVYLLSFIVGFGARGWYKRPLWLRLLAMGLGLLGYSVYGIDSVEPIQISLPIFLGGLFVCCMFCQGELFLHRPAASKLTGFYLAIAAGGAAGAIFTGLIAPHLFAGVYELPFTLAVTALLALAATWQESGWAGRMLWIGVAAAMCAVFVLNVAAYRENSLVLVRSFYGSLRVTQTPLAGPEQTRILFHGTVQHGAEYVWPDRQRRAITYYGPDSGIAIVLRECLPNGPRRIGVVGLGTGTLAAFGQAGDTIRFYELNPQVIAIANSLFFFTRQSLAHVETVEGDARLSLQRERDRFDVLVLDAFSGDAIPVHLLTREALTLYARLLKPDGVIAVHVSNNYLALAPVIKQLADASGFQTLEVKNKNDEDNKLFASDWVLATKNARVLENEAIRRNAQPIERRDGLRAWTDGYNNLLQILRWPK